MADSRVPLPGTAGVRKARDFHGKNQVICEFGGLNHRISWDLNGHLNGSVIGLLDYHSLFFVTSLI